MTQCQVHHLSFTLPDYHLGKDLPKLMRELFDVEGFDPLTTQQRRGRAGYRECYILRDANGAELIAILVDGQSKHLRCTTHIDVRGGALETGAIDVPKLCQAIIDRRGWGTIIHLSADSSHLQFFKILDCSGSDVFESRITTSTCRPLKNRVSGLMEPQPPVYLRSSSETIYYGNKSSESSICIYTQRGPVRVEVRDRNRAAATDIIKRIASGENINEVTLGIIGGKITFHDEGAKRKDRKPITDWWLTFLAGVAPLKLERERGNENRSPWYVVPSKNDIVDRCIEKQMPEDPAEQIKFISKISDTLACYSFGNQSL